MKPALIVALWVGVAIGGGGLAYIAKPDPTLDACARDHNVYACEYVAQPIQANLLPPPTNEKE